MNYVLIKQFILDFLCKANINLAPSQQRDEANYYQGNHNHPLNRFMTGRYNQSSEDSDSEYWQPGAESHYWRLGDELTKHEIETPCDTSYSVEFNAVLFVKIYFSLYFQNKYVKSRFTLTQQSHWNPFRFLFQQHITTCAEQTQSKQWVINHALNFILCAYNKDQLFYFLQKETCNLLSFYSTNTLINCLLLPKAFAPIKHHLLVYLLTLSRTQRQKLLSKQKLNQFKNQVQFNSTENEMTAWINKRQNEILSSDHFVLTQLPIQLKLDKKPKFSENKYIEITSLLQDLRQHYNQASLLFTTKDNPSRLKNKQRQKKLISPSQKKQIKKARKIGLKTPDHLIQKLIACELHIPYSELKKTEKTEQAFFKAIKLLCERNIMEPSIPNGSHTSIQ